MPNPSKSSPGGLWKRQNDFLPTCHKGLHDHLRSVMSMHFWRFYHFFELFCIFWVNWIIERSPVLKKKIKKNSGASCSRTLHSWIATTPYHREAGTHIDWTPGTPGSGKKNLLATSVFLDTGTTDSSDHRVILVLNALAWSCLEHFPESVNYFLWSRPVFLWPTANFHIPLAILQCELNLNLFIKWMNTEIGTEKL